MPRVSASIHRPRSWRGLRLLGCALLPALVTSGCGSTYVRKTQRAQVSFRAGKPAAALKQLESKAEDIRAKDRLLFLLDKGMMEHAEGSFEQSIKTLGEAEKLGASLGFFSISENTLEILTDERRGKYRGEDFEFLFVNIIQALNYNALGDVEGALVEARRLNEKIQVLSKKRKGGYEPLALARYLGGALYEMAGERDSAFIDYLSAAKLVDLGYLFRDFWRLGEELGRPEAERLREEQGREEPKRSEFHPEMGTLVVVIESGSGPTKISTRRRDSAAELVVLPLYVHGTPSPYGRSVRIGEEEVRTVLLADVSSIAQRDLSRRLASLTGRQLAGVAARGALAAGIGAATDSSDLGFLAFWLMNLGKNADTRSWRSLPAEFRVARASVQPGTHTLTCGRRKTEVQVRAGRLSLHHCKAY